MFVEKNSTILQMDLTFQQTGFYKLIPYLPGLQGLLHCFTALPAKPSIGVRTEEIPFSLYTWIYNQSVCNCALGEVFDGIRNQ